MAEKKDIDKRRRDSNGRILPAGISQRRDGLYVGRFSYFGDRYSVYGRTISETAKKLTEKKHDVWHHNVRHVDGNVTLDEWYRKWLDIYKKNSLKEQTLRQYDYKWNKHISPQFGSRRLCDIRRIELVSFFQKLYYKDGLKRQTVRWLEMLLHEVLQEAVDNELIGKNPVSGIAKEISRNASEEKCGTASGMDGKQILDQKTAEEFLAFMKEEYMPYYPYFAVAAWTGMRCGEISALTWSDIDFAGGWIHVRRNVSVVTSGGGKESRYLIGTPKTEKAVRDVPLHPEAEKALRMQKELQASGIMPRTMSLQGHNDYVFISRRNRPFIGASAAYYIRKYIAHYNEKEQRAALEAHREVKLLKPFGMHAFRHYFISRCIEAGMNPKAVQEIVGHSRYQFTMDVYTHCSNDFKKEQFKML